MWVIAKIVNWNFKCSMGVAYCFRKRYQQGRIEQLKAARGYATSRSLCIDGIVLSVTGSQIVYNLLDSINNLLDKANNLLGSSMLCMRTLHRLTYLGQGISHRTQTVPLLVIGGLGLGMH